MLRGHHWFWHVCSRFLNIVQVLQCSGHHHQSTTVQCHYSHACCHITLPLLLWTCMQWSLTLHCSLPSTDSISSSIWFCCYLIQFAHYTVHTVHCKCHWEINGNVNIINQAVMKPQHINVRQLASSIPKPNTILSLLDAAAFCWAEKLDKSIIACVANSWLLLSRGPIKYNHYKQTQTQAHISSFIYLIRTHRISIW